MHKKIVPFIKRPLAIFCLFLLLVAIFIWVFCPGTIFQPARVTDKSVSIGGLQAFLPLADGTGDVVRDAAGRHPGLIRASEANRAPQWCMQDNIAGLVFPGGKGGGHIEISRGGQIISGDHFIIKADISPRNDNSAGVLLACKHESLKDGGFLLFYWGAMQQITFSFADGHSTHTYSASLPEKIKAGTWATVEVRYDGRALTIKVNDAAVAVHETPGLNMKPSSNSLLIGGYYNDLSPGFEGRIRNVALIMPFRNVSKYTICVPPTFKETIKNILRPPKQALMTALQPLESPALTALDDHLYIANNLIVPNWFHLGAPAGKIVSLNPVYYLDIPLGVQFVHAGSRPGLAYMFAAVIDYRRLGEVQHNNSSYQRFALTITSMHPTDQSFPVYLSSTLTSGKIASLYFSSSWDGGSQSAQKIDLIIKRFPEPGPPARLCTTIGWMTAANGMAWPGFFETYRKLGFNTVAVHDVDAQFIKKELVAYAAEARSFGLKIVYVDSPLAFVGLHQEANSLISGVGTPNDLCPAYRGKFFHDEIARVADMATLLRPEYAFWDIECYGDGAYAGLTGQCERCNDYTARTGKSSRQAMNMLGTSIAADIRKAILKNSGHVPLIGIYHTQPQFAYQDVFAFDQMYENGVDFSQPEFYDSQQRKEMGEALRAIKKTQNNSNIIPWLQPGTVKDYPSAWIYDGVLEVFGSGLRGLSWYAFHEMEGEDFYYFAKAMAAVNPVEKILMDGEPLAGVTSRNALIAASAICTDAECVLLLSDYSTRPFDGAVVIQMPRPLPGDVWDLSRRKKVGSPGSKTIELNFKPGITGAHTALYYIGERQFKKHIAQQ